MSNEELAMAIQRGENRYEELWEQVRRFVCQQANAYRLYFPVSTIDTDDLIQAGYLAFVDAVQVYDPDAGRFKQNRTPTRWRKNSPIFWNVP